MLRYMVVKECKVKGEGDAIYACDICGDKMEILARTRVLHARPGYLAQLVAVLNESDVAPIHLEEIVEDALTE